MRYFKSMMVAAALLAAMPGAALAQEMIGSYVAYIGRDDLYNSKGARLTEPWQILRQDRANFHRFGVSQPGGDDWDSFFGDIDNRAAMERMIMNGYINRSPRVISWREGGPRSWSRSGGAMAPPAPRCAWMFTAEGGSDTRSAPGPRAGTFSQSARGGCGP